MLVRRNVRGHRDELVRAERLRGGARHIHMFGMDGVEGPAEDRDFHLLLFLYGKDPARIYLLRRFF